MAKITPDVLKAVNDDINNLKAKKPLQNYKAPTPPAPALLQGIDRSVLSNINTDIGNMNAGNNLQFAQQPTPTPTPTVPEPTVNPQTAAIQSYLQSTQQTEEEKGLNTRIADITGQTLGGQTMIGGEPISAGAMTGRKNYLSRESLAQLQPLQAQVANLMAQRDANKATTIGDTTYSPTGEALFTKPTEAESTKPVSLAQGATLVDPTTGQVIASGKAKEQSMSEKYGTGAMGEYNFYSEQETEAGNTPLSFDQYQTRDANRKLKASQVGADSESYNLASAVIDNPSLFNQLTATEKGNIAPILNSMGFTAFGKNLSDGATKEITQLESGLESLEDLRVILEENEQYLGPIKGLQKLNPWSEARQVQADVDRVRQTVGKALEGGVLRKEDEEKYKKILATLMDTPKTASYKIRQLQITLARDLENYKNAQILAGRSVPSNQSQNDNPLDLNL